MLTFAISLLFTAGAAFALLVIVGMLVGNARAIRSALLGDGAFAQLRRSDGTAPPHNLVNVRVGPVRRGRSQFRQQPVTVTALRAAA